MLKKIVKINIKILEKLTPFFYSSGKTKIAIFLSGNGTNAEKILEFWFKDKENCSFEPSLLICDRQCNAKKLSQQYNITLIEHNIFDFYQQHKLDSISLITDAGQTVRHLWTEELIKKLQPYEISFGVFAGFIPLSNITDVFPCLNIHPGDLSYQKDNKRKLIGLHKKPIYATILEKLPYMSSSVIVADKFQDKGQGMDEGVILGISPKVPIDYLKEKPEFYQNKSYKELHNFLEHNLNKLKENGDWVVFPRVVDEFAQQKFMLNDKKELFYKLSHSNFIPIEYIIYDKQEREIIFN